MYIVDNLCNWLIQMNIEKASDIYLTYESYPIIRGDYGFKKLDDANEKLSMTDMNAIVGYLLLPDQHATFNFKKEYNMSLDLQDGGRYRVNIMQQRGVPAIVIRRIPLEIPSLTDLGIPKLLGELCCFPRGLILVVGATGSGKSTSLASMIDFRNQTKPGHILTIEDPIEYIHQHKKCIVSQREVGTDTESFDVALKQALRQHPDVILVGEIRDAITMKHALNISETGHLALATLHANNADQAIERILTFFPYDQHKQVLMTLSFNLKAILSQRLVERKDGKRSAVLEIMLNEGKFVDLIRQGKTNELKSHIAQHRDLGMQTFDQALFDLYQKDIITKETALIEADNRVELNKILTSHENN